MTSFRQNCWAIKDKFSKIRAVLIDEARMLYDCFDICFTPFYFRMFWQYMFIPRVIRTNYCYSVSTFTFKYIHLPSLLSMGGGTY